MIPFLACKTLSQHVHTKDCFNMSYEVTVVPTKSDSDVMFCLQSYQVLMIDRLLVY